MQHSQFVLRHPIVTISRASPTEAMQHNATQCYAYHEKTVSVREQRDSQRPCAHRPSKKCACNSLGSVPLFCASPAKPRPALSAWKTMVHHATPCNTMQHNVTRTRRNLSDPSHAEQAQLATTTSSCRTNAGLEERALYSNGLPCRRRYPSPMESVLDEGG
jgi:hypothetical protein